jgi:acyl-CoA synthetase (AMP-forming)/AMP-acid ligase II
MQGLIMDEPLLISDLIRRAERHHGDTEIVSRTLEGGMHRYGYADAHARARRLAKALLAQGVTAGDRVATLAWNGYRHFELYYGVSGIGAVIHTINPRLFPDQVAWIANDAEDRCLFFDLSFVPLVEQLAPRLASVKSWVLMTDRAHMPKSTSIPNLLCYEDLIDAQSDSFEWPKQDERSASCLCYTSGTTGNPKGVLYHHRSTLLHAFSAALPDTFNLSARDVVLPVVPMFHVNAWGLPYAATLTGAKLVFPGSHLDGKSLYELFESERVTISAGVPTVWLGLLAFLDENRKRLSLAPRLMIGGSACPPALIRRLEDDFGITVRHAWGMTEMSPLGSVCTLKEKHRDLGNDALHALQCKAGRPVYGVEMKIVDEAGRELPHDGKAFGDLLVRGQAVLSSYYKGAGGNPLRDGWFPTGDVATLDADCYMQITDRSKDVIKSGGEWISSIDLENIAVAHPAIAEAAVIGVHHPKWDERPIVVAVKKAGAEVSREELLGFYEGKVPKWWLPDDVLFVAELPHTATGKLSKLTLRQQLKDYKLNPKETAR